MTDLAAWDRFAALLTDDPRVAPQVRLALTDPAAYLAEQRKVLFHRGIDRPENVSGVIALVDALGAAGDLAYLDWKGPAEEIADEVGALPAVRATGIVIDGVPDHAEYLTDPVVAAINRLLAPAGVVVLTVEEESDGCPLVAVPVDRRSALVAAGAAVGVRVREPR